MSSAHPMAQLIMSGVPTGISQTIQLWSSVTALRGLGIVWSKGERAMTKTTDKYTFIFHGD